MTFIDLFAGIGGFRRGMELAGHKCVGFCEFDKYAVMSYTMMHLATEEQRKFIESIPAPPKKNGEPNLKKRQKEILKEEYRNGEWYANDIRTVDAGSVPKADCWCFGAPCQDFSIAGKRAGLDGDRSSLVREVFRILGEIEEENRPEWLIYENVKGMLSSNRGFDYLAILLAMDELGYDIEWQLFNSKDWGVPQNRERVYTVGHLRRCGARKIFPLEGADGENSVSIEFQSEGFGHEQNGRFYSVDGLSPCLNGIGNRGNHEPKVVIPVLTLDRAEWSVYDMHNKCIRDNGICGTLTGSGNISTTHCGSFGLMIPVKEKSKQGYSIAYEGDAIDLKSYCSSTRRGTVKGRIAGTLDQDCSQGIFVQVSDDLTAYAIWYEKYQCYIAIRRLTPKECFRLQGWEDIYFERAAAVNSGSQLYKQAGNGVTVPVVQTIAERME